MDVDKLTINVQKTLNEAQLTAVKYNHQQVDVIHLFSALVNQEEGLIPNIISKMGIDLKLMKEDVVKVLGKMPKVLGEGAETSNVYATRRFEDIFVKAENWMKKFKDSYISVEHVMLGLMEIKSTDVEGILKKYNLTKDAFLNTLEGVRG